MILLIEAKIVSDTLIDEELVIKQYPFTIKLYPDSNRILNRISIEKAVIEFMDYIPRVEIENHQIVKIEFREGKILAEYEEILKHIESIGALDLGIREIKWDNPTIEWIPENEGERLMLPLPKYGRKHQFEQIVRKVTIGWLRDTIIFRKQLSHLALPFSFYRKGVNLYHRFEYSEAFLNFYFMLEGIFGNGKTKNGPVKEEFLKSDFLDFAIDTFLNNLDKDNYENHNIWLVNYLSTKKNNTINKESIISMLVDKRGELSHFSARSTKNQRNNFNENENQSPAFIIMSICLSVTTKLRLAPFRKGEEMS
jgi:hypothetical protein